MARKAIRRDGGKERFWREVLRRQAGSGQSVRAFCLEAGLKESAFYFWRRELKKREEAKQNAQLDSFAGDVEKKADAGGGELFVPVVAESLVEPSIKSVKKMTGATVDGKTSSGTTAAAAVEMILPSGSVLRWFGDDATSTIDWIAALEARLC